MILFACGFVSGALVVVGVGVALYRATVRGVEREWSGI